ncbi:S-methyl-5'-thioadenosine phosphorylase [Desulfococcaceae bacterium HSG8]|nr:S-methyl-5'-thioadenosine phosphorylase [Desulfococcaceae bacterium HSG8]
MVNREDYGMAKIGIIGGSGLDDPRILQEPEEIIVDTPYGRPTSELTVGKISGADVVLLARHGKQHQFSPTQVNYRANIHALKDQGVTHIIATTACGSLREDIDRGNFVIIDQFIDFTKHRKNTFHESFENGIEHPAMAEPFDAALRKILYETSEGLGFRTHNGGTVVTIEGPRFSTRAESRMFRIWGADIINMSVATEASLANEAGIPYAAVAMSTDYDCWKEDEELVTWQEILQVFEKNADNVKKLLTDVVSKIE